MEKEEEEFLYKLGQRIIDIRDSKEISQELAAFESELSVNTFSKIECGKTNSGIFTYYKIAKGLGTPLNQLIAEAQYEPLIKSKELKEIIDLLQNQDHETLKFIQKQINAVLDYNKKIKKFLA